jgi:hypothetical protein
MSDQSIVPQQEFSLMELIEAIYSSGLSQGKKLAYLSMIADGSFSMDHLDGLLKDMDETGLRLKQKKKRVQKSLETLEAKKEQLEEELMQLQIKAAEEQLVNTEKFLDAVTRIEEQSAESGKQKSIEKIKSTLNKKL